MHALYSQLAISNAPVLCNVHASNYKYSVNVSSVRHTVQISLPFSAISDIFQNENTPEPILNISAKLSPQNHVSKLDDLRSMHNFKAKTFM